MADKSLTPIDLPELSSAPASPASGFHRFYAKTDGKPYSKSSSGTEYDLTAGVSLTTTGTSGAATLVGTTLNIPVYQSALTNPVTGTGTAGQVTYFSGTSAVTGSADLTWNDTTKVLAFSNGGTLTNEIRVSSVPTNTIVGRAAGASASLTGVFNSFFGRAAGNSNTTGALNSFFGRESGVKNTIGNYNSCYGVNSGYNNTTGDGNSFFGVDVGFSNTTGINNSFFGLQSGYSNTTGGNNSFFGLLSGRYLNSGSELTVSNNSVFLGYDTRANGNSETNQIVIGYEGRGLGSNTTVIGNTSTTQTHLHGNLTVGTTTSGGRATFRGSGTTSATVGLLVENSTPTANFTIRDDGGFAFRGGTVGVAQTGYTTFTNLTTDRTCNANATTVEELADILGTLIEDLKTKGIIAA